VQVEDANEREQVLTFGPFQLYRDHKLLLENGRLVRLGNRAIDLLVALVERAGEVVGKNELIAYVWPGSFVEENNLRVHIASLRKCLGEVQTGTRYIVNVAGRGYCFVAPVTRALGPAPRVSPGADLGNLPTLMARPLGRSEAIAALTNLLAKHRLVTIVGAGGIGKSTVALAVADQLRDVVPHKVYFADLAAVAAPSMVAAAIASAIGAAIHTDDPVGSLIANLRDPRTLLLLDNCEHVVGHVADIAVRLLKATQVTVLATSREPLLADGEQVYRLAALEVPPAGANLTCKAALGYAAIQLFVEHAMNGSERFALTDANVGRVATICRLLDGVPLAIEIVAARAALAGIDALDLGNGDSGVLAVSGKRTAPSRQRSMHATLEWSYEHLSEIERTVLRRLAVFRGQFSAASAVAVAAADGIGDAQALEAVMSLAAKSLLSTEISGPELSYRLLHITRVYATELLVDSGEAGAAHRRHAEHWCRYLEAAIHKELSLTRAQWLTLHRSSIGDIRAALEWAFDAGGDARLGAHLTMAAVAFGFQLSLIDEFKARTALALSAVQRFAVPDPDLEVRLSVALSILRVRTAESAEATGAQMERVVALAKESGVVQNTIWLLTERALTPLDFGDYARAVDMLGELEAVARKEDDASAALTADRVGAIVLHWAGLHTRSRVLAERVLRHPAAAIPTGHSGVSVSRQVSMRIVLSRILWLEGAADQARDFAAEAVDIAASDSPNALCDALGHAACPIAFWRGDLEAANAYTLTLLDYARRYTLSRWYIAGLCFQQVVSTQSNHGAHDDTTPLPGLQRDLLATMTHRWVDATTLERGRHRLAGWCSPELMRVAGELQSVESEDNAQRLAEVSFLQALECAREQRALAWELRAATSLARVRLGRDRRTEAQRMLRSICDRFTEGHSTADWLQAQAVLRDLGG
jgi:predicted ATPase/DNA-binding winged helix-turn-helix (wHTH) protein